LTDEESRARNRFIAINLVGIAGTIFALLSLLLWQTDLIVEGGSIIGFPLAALGVAISFIGPRILVRKWRTPRP
jgi:hypothetical protein